MVIAIVSCGKQRVEQTVVTLKSAIAFSKQRLHFVIMADDDNKTELTDRVRTNIDPVLFECSKTRAPDPRRLAGRCPQPNLVRNSSC